MEYTVKIVIIIALIILLISTLKHNKSEAFPSSFVMNGQPYSLRLAPLDQPVYWPITYNGYSIPYGYGNWLFGW